MKNNLPKCIKVLLPTGEVRLEENGNGLRYYPAAYDLRSYQVLNNLIKESIYNITPEHDPDFVGDWVRVTYLDDKGQEKSTLAQVVAKYGDKFPDMD